MIRSILNRPIVHFVSLLVLNIVLLSVQLRAPTGKTLLRSWTLTLLSPVLLGTSYASGRVVTVWEDYVSLVGTHKQNRRLQRENHQLRLDVQRLQELDWMHAQVDVYQRFRAQFQYSTVIARVVSKSPPFWRSTVVLNVGGADGVRVGDAVITTLGVVGRVLNASPVTCEVELITNPGAGVGIRVGEGRVQGVTQGSGDETLSIRYISNQEQVHPGDLVVTSGTDRIYPPGLPVGRVVVSQNSSQVFKDVTLKTLTNLPNLQEVMVLTGYHFRP
jgi:rod shape-determining protein MreC